MSDDEKVVDGEQSSDKENVSEEVVKETTTEPTPEDVLNQKITEAVSKALAVETEKAKREIQSTKDKAKAEVESAQRRAKLAEGIQTATRTQIKELDPETAKEFELVQLRAESQGRLSFDQEEQTRRQTEVYQQNLSDSLYAHLKELGIDPNDEGIDWAGDSPDYVSGRRRFDVSVTKIIKERESASKESMVKELTEKIKKDLGVEDANSVDTAISGGVSKSGIPTNMDKFRTWVANISQEDYEKLKPEVDKMMAGGKIK